MARCESVSDFIPHRCTRNVGHEPPHWNGLHMWADVTYPVNYIEERSLDKPAIAAIIEEVKYALPGGATRSEQAPAYHLVPPDGLRRIAQRFALGAKKHGEYNWERSIIKEEDAAAFAKEAYNHMLEHTMKMIGGRHVSDDHLAAIGWAVVVLAQIEAIHGKPWTQLKGMVPV